VSLARNGRRLLSNDALAGDVALCFAMDRLHLVARLHADGVIRTGEH